jgi:hypothetical protein
MSSAASAARARPSAIQRHLNECLISSSGRDAMTGSPAAANMELDRRPRAPKVGGLRDVPTGAAHLGSIFRAP